MTKEVAKQTVETKLIDMLDALQNGAVEIGNKVVKYSPDIADTVLWVVRIDSASYLLQAILIAWLLPVAFFLAKKGVRHHNNYRLWRNDIEGKYREFRDDDDKALACFVPAAFLGFAGAIGILCVINVWEWIGLFEPKLYLAKQIIKSVLP